MLISDTKSLRPLRIQQMHQCIQVRAIVNYCSHQLCIVVQSNMQEASRDVIEVHDIDGTTLKTLIAAMYGEQENFPTDVLPSLFLAADRHQVSCDFLQVQSSQPLAMPAHSEGLL